MINAFCIELYRFYPLATSATSDRMQASVKILSYASSAISRSVPGNFPSIKH